MVSMPFYHLKKDHVLSGLVVVVNFYLTRVIPSEYLKVYLLSIGAFVSKRTENIFRQTRTYWRNGVEEINTGGVYFLILI